MTAAQEVNPEGRRYTNRCQSAPLRLWVRNNWGIEAQPGHRGATWPSGYLVIKVFLGASSGDHRLNEVFRKNSEPMLDPTVPCSSEQWPPAARFGESLLRCSACLQRTSSRPPPVSSDRADLALETPVRCGRGSRTIDEMAGAGLGRRRGCRSRSGVDRRVPHRSGTGAVGSRAI